MLFLFPFDGCSPWGQGACSSLHIVWRASENTRWRNVVLAFKRWAFYPIVNWETNTESRLHKNIQVITEVDVNLKCHLLPLEMELPWWAQIGSESACNAGEPVLMCALGRSPGRKWQSAPASLPGESHGQRSVASYSPWGCKELDMTEWLTLHFFPL